MDILQNNKPRKQLQGWLSIDYWNNILLILYVLTMPFISAFAFTGTISLPLIFSVFLFFLMGMQILKSGKFPDGFIGVDIMIIFFLLFFVGFTFLTKGWGNTKSLNHSVAYFSTFLLFYITIKFTLFNIKDKKLLLKRVLQYIAYTTILSALYGNVEFISSNVFGVNLNDYIPRPSGAEEFYNPTVLALYYRTRGFAIESGVYTQMLELFAPLTIYYLYFCGQCRWLKIWRALFTISIILSIIFAASSATFIILPVAIVFSSLVYIKNVLRLLATKSWIFYIKTILVVIVVLIVNSYLSIYTSILLSISDKFDSNSLNDRQDRINFFFTEFSKFDPVNKLIGAGPAGSHILGFEDSGTIISLYYNVAFELGIIGLLLLLFFIGYVFLYSFFIKSRIGFFLMIAFVSGTMHYYVVNDFWVPWFWFIAAFIIFYTKTFGNEILIK